MAAVSLRDYQLDILSRLREAWRTHRSVMVQMPTGTGKTHVLAAVVSEECNVSGGAVWIVAHRRELVEQIKETLRVYDIDSVYDTAAVGGMTTDDWTAEAERGVSVTEEDGGETGACVRVMSVQWLARHWDDVAEVPRLIIIDEAHHALADTYTELWKRFPDAGKLGVTATPCRMSHKGFTDLFDVLITSYSIAEFIRQGHLSLFDYVSIGQNSAEQRVIDSLEKRGADGDYQIKEMDCVLNRRCSIERLYWSVTQFAGGKKGIVYAVSIDHARNIAEYYGSKGLKSAAIDSRTPVAERRRTVEAFKAGDIRVLVNVDVFSEGFDCPDVEFVQMARPTLSLSKYLQQVGRGLRKADGKDVCVLIDNVGLYRMFGLPTVAWDWGTLFRGEVSGKGQVGRKRRACVPVPASLSVRNVMSGIGGSIAVAGDIGGMNIVMSHDRLLAEICGSAATQTEKVPELMAWHDSGSGLWGLLCGKRKVTDAVYTTVFDIRYGMAAVRFGDRKGEVKSSTKCGLVDSDGSVVWERSDCPSLRFIGDDFLAVTLRSGKEQYVDLRSMQVYDRHPVVEPYGGIELLKVGDMYYSRTKTRYAACRPTGRLMVSRRGFYLTIFDCDVPAPGIRPSDYPYGYQSGDVCLLAGDYDSFYWMFRHLADGSIIVRDTADRFYHVAEGRGKKFIGRYAGVADAEGEKCLVEIKRMTMLAEDSVRLSEESKERQRLQAMIVRNDAVPFRSGMKWGLKSGSRVVVPPIYRTVRMPVGRYCAVEKSYSQWGIITLDGKVIVEPKYPEVSIGANGTAVLTSVTGKKKAVKL